MQRVAESETAKEGQCDTVHVCGRVGNSKGSGRKGAEDCNGDRDTHRHAHGRGNKRHTKTTQGKHSPESLFPWRHRRRECGASVPPSNTPSSQSCLQHMDPGTVSQQPETGVVPLCAPCWAPCAPPAPVPRPARRPALYSATKTGRKGAGMGEKSGRKMEGGEGEWAVRATATAVSVAAVADRRERRSRSQRQKQGFRTTLSR